MIKLKTLLYPWLANLTRKLKSIFLYLFGHLIHFVVLLDASLFHVGENMRNVGFDFMAKNRLI